MRRVIFLLAVLLVAHQARAAGGAFAVDDAAVDAPGRCKVESWFSAADSPTSDWNATIAPVCALPLLGHRFELGPAFQRARAGGEYGSAISLKAKTPVPGFDLATGERFGLALTVGGSLDAATGNTHTIFLNAPLTIRVAEPLTININAGYSEDRIDRRGFATWGAGFELNLKPVALDKITLIAETFSNHTERAATQVGLRYTPFDKLDIDLIYGYNLAGEQASWLTVGMNFRF